MNSLFFFISFSLSIKVIIKFFRKIFYGYFIIFKCQIGNRGYFCINVPIRMLISFTRFRTLFDLALSILINRNYYCGF